jgi:hypothetical protein
MFIEIGKVILNTECISSVEDSILMENCRDKTGWNYTKEFPAILVTMINDKKFKFKMSKTDFLNIINNK